MNDKHKAMYESLNLHEKRGLKELAKSFIDFEPLAKRNRIGKTIAAHLVSLGLAETGVSENYSEAHFGPGYRLTDLGWKVYGEKF